MITKYYFFYNTIGTCDSRCSSDSSIVGVVGVIEEVVIVTVVAEG